MLKVVVVEEVTLDMILDQQDLLVELLLQILLVVLVEVRRDLLGVQTTRVELREVMEIQDLGLVLVLLNHLLVVAEVEQEVVDLHLLQILMVVMGKLYLGYYQHGVIPNTSLAVVEEVVK